ncbi:reverse transcriptase domain-containing protein [Tanacetum coccineum]|uniref:Reverse transcriptase domain-containing protein n=1 Tax=Tanacetum coccineum TaxID=301880 RepID=A0ABQ5HHT6_9ASTR
MKETIHLKTQELSICQFSTSTTSVTFLILLKIFSQWMMNLCGLLKTGCPPTPGSAIIILETTNEFAIKDNIIKIFYHGLSKITQDILNAAAGGIFLYKTPNQAYQLFEDKVLLKLDWDKNQKTKSSLKKTVAFADEVRINVPLIDVLARMPNYGKFLKELISNKHKIEQISAAFLRDESSAMIQNKVPPKLGDPGSFLIPCNFNKTFSCNALADLGASINLMPYSLYAKLSLERLADRSFQYPIGIAKNMLVEVVIRVKQKQLNLGVRTEQMIFNIDSAMKHCYSNDDTCFSIDVIDEILEEDFDALLDEGSKILHSIKGTLLEEEIFVEFDKFMAMTADENSDYESDTEDPPFKKITKQNLPWVSPIHYVPKKCGITVVTNENDEPVPTRTITGWRNSSKSSRTISLSVGNSFDTCLNNLDKMLQHCKDAHLILNWEKCHFMVKEGIVLGYKVSSVGLEVDKAKIDVISKLPPPTNIKGIRSFLEHAGFYRRFVKDFLKIARPLTKLLEKDTPFEFNDECQKAFELLKERLTCAPVIVSPNWNLSFELMCDASDFTVGVVLGQKYGKNFHPIYFASKTLNFAQQKYTVTEKELMTVVFTFDKFKSYLILSKSIVHPDHSALSTYSKNQEANHAIIRMDLTSIRKLNIEIKDRKGSRKFRGPITYPDLKMMKQAMIVKSMITFPEKLLWKSTPKMNHGSQTLQTT